MLYQRVPLESTEPVSFVCYHPIVASKLPKFDRNFEPLEPTCLMVEYEYDSILGELRAACGWQGGTVWQVIEEIKKLRAAQGIAKSSAQQTEGRVTEPEIIDGGLSGPVPPNSGKPELRPS